VAADGLDFRGTVGPGGGSGQSRPDPLTWLGRSYAAESIHSLQSTLTANQDVSRRNEIIDSARIGDGANAHALKWMAILTGPAALAAARVMSFDDATGTFKLDRELGPGLAVSGNAYRLFNPGNVFGNLSAAQAVDGITDYRSIALFNASHGAAVNDIKIYFRPLGSLRSDIIDRTHQGGSGGLWIERSDVFTDIFDSLGGRIVGTGSDGFLVSGGWLHPFGYATADVTYTTMNPTAFVGIWLRRKLPAGSAPGLSLAIQIIAEASNTGSDPDPLAVSGIICFDIGSAPVEGLVQADRFVHVGGGARIDAQLDRLGAPIAQRPVQFGLRLGEQGIIIADDDPLAGYSTTDDEGRASATYTLDLLATEGGLAHPRAIIGAGEEVADPRPRVSFSAVILTPYSVQAAVDIDAPQTSRTYIDDPLTERVHTA